MFEEPLFSVYQENEITKIVNNSEWTLLIYLNPIKPKRTFKFFSLVQSNCFIIYDFSIDLTKISFSLDK